MVGRFSSFQNIKNISHNINAIKIDKVRQRFESLFLSKPLSALYSYFKPSNNPPNTMPNKSCGKKRKIQPLYRRFLQELPLPLSPSVSANQTSLATTISIPWILKANERIKGSGGTKTKKRETFNETSKRTRHSQCLECSFSLKTKKERATRLDVQIQRQDEIYLNGRRWFC